MSEVEVEDELLLASMCGLPPYSPDQLIDFLIIDGVVEARVPDYFHQPRASHRGRRAGAAHRRANAARRPRCRRCGSAGTAL